MIKFQRLVWVVVSIFAMSLSASAQSTWHDCPVYGDNPRFYDADRLKNRYQIPTQYLPIDFATMASMRYDADADQNSAVKLHGYVILVKYGGTETCNCHSTDKDDFDVHIVLSNSEEDADVKDGIVVELTPRMRSVLNNGWDKDAVKELFYHKWVTVYGYLFDDKEHKAMSAADGAHADNTHRASCWEVHPVTNIVADERQDKRK